MATRLPVEVENQIDRMTEAFRQRLTELFQWSNDEETDRPPTAVEIEDKIREWIRQIGEDTQTLVLGSMDRYRHKGKQCCPRCGEAVYWERYEPRNCITTLGDIQLERAYYNHPTCHCGWVPMDKRLEIGASELSPRVLEMLSYLGGFMPFGKAQAFRAKYCDIHVSHDTVNTGTVAIVWGEETDRTTGWGEKHCHRLKHDGPAPVLRELRALSLVSNATPEPVAKAITYFENQSPRMNYPLYVEQGLQIGSGSAESGVKQVVGCRINQAGMRWNPERAEAVAHVRATILSDGWDDFWSDFHPPPRQYRRKEVPVVA